MIITLIGIGMVILSIIFSQIADNITTSVDSIFYTIGGLNLIIGSIISCICFVSILSAHIGVQYQISSNQIEYEGLCNRLVIVNSEYENISKSEVIKDVTKWNQDVYGYKYWAYSPWTNWMYNKKIADELKYIEYNAGDI